MRTQSDRHGQEHSELVCLYALQSLPSAERPVVAAQITACDDCRHELETLQPVMDAFVSWPTDMLRPSAPLWDRLAQRVGLEAPARSGVPATPPWVKPEWKDVAPGIACKLLATDPETHRVTMLVRLAAGTDYPAHRHHGIEELYMLAGELIVDEQTYRPGEYRRAAAGTVDHRVWSEAGCTCLLITSGRDVIV
jgi:anti-sigma factor ChrR (cupin superfamily)